MASKEFFGNLLLVAGVFIAVPWCVFFWEESTGLTVASRRHLGRNATEQDVKSARKIAIGSTLFWTPIAIWCVLERRDET